MNEPSPAASPRVPQETLDAMIQMAESGKTQRAIVEHFATQGLTQPVVSRLLRGAGVAPYRNALRRTPSRPTPLTPEQEAAVLQACQEAVTTHEKQKDIAARFGVTQVRVSKIARENGIRRHQPRVDQGQTRGPGETPS